jgi:hypothetical protein
VEGAGD